MSSRKKQLGQFMTVDSNFILQGLSIPETVKCIIEPFAGKMDLLRHVPPCCLVELYDIDPQDSRIERRDCLAHPPTYDGKFIITNPPYLARNKSEEKEIFNRYQTNDLYKAFLMTVLDQDPEGGILILPVNFISSVMKSHVALRSAFMTRFTLKRVNIFETRVFPDTSYSVCSFQFERKTCSVKPTPFYVYGRGEPRFASILLHEGNNWCPGGHMYQLPKPKLFTISRLMGSNPPNTRINVRCIDSEQEPIGLEISHIPHPDQTPNGTERVFATLSIEPLLNEEQQKALVSQFNAWLQKERDASLSLFLPSYRDRGRKRIPFDLLYRMIASLLENRV